MGKNTQSEWEAANESEMLSSLDVLYEMATGYVLGELRNVQPVGYAKLLNHGRLKMQFVNNIRYSMDLMLAEIIKEYSSDINE